MRIFIAIIITMFSFSLFAQNENHLCSQSKLYNNKSLLKTTEINYPGDDRFDVTYYKLNLNISYYTRFINGIVTIKAKSLVDNLSSIFLDLQNYFIVDSVKLGTTILKSNLSSNKLTIELDKAYNMNEGFLIDVFYKGSPGSSGFGSFEFSSHNGNPAIWTLSEPYGASDWWPSKDTPADKADSSDVWIRSNDFFVSVSNGKLIEVIDHKDGTKTYKWKNHYPIAHYLISLAMSNYSEYKNYFEYLPGDTMEVIHYNYPEKLNNDRKIQLDRTVQMLQVFSELFGPYPYLNEKYGHAEFGWGGGMEHQTISSMGSFGSGIVSHELAHQWFGDMITCKDWHHIWLNEGFATYAEALFVEATNGYNAYKNYIKNEMTTAKNAVGTIYVQNIKSISEIFDGSRSYAKGSVVLHMLRGIVGDDNFFKILKAYAADSQLAYNVATTEDFQRVCEEVSEMDLNYFFNQWIYGSDFPNYVIDWGYSQIGEKYDFRINISQTTHKFPSYFVMPVQIKINGAIQDTIITLFNNYNHQIFNFELPFEPLSILFDPNNWILKNVSNITTDVENDERIQNDFILFQNYPNPFNPSTTIKYSIPSSNVISNEMENPNDFSPQATSNENVNITLKVYDILGRVVSTLVDEQQKPGNYEVIFDGTNLTSGIYYYQLKVGNEQISSKKMILIK